MLSTRALLSTLSSQLEVKKGCSRLYDMRYNPTPTQPLRAAVIRSGQVHGSSAPELREALNGGTMRLSVLASVRCGTTSGRASSNTMKLTTKADAAAKC